MAIQFLSALNIDGTVTATINQDANAGYDGILVSTSGLIERRTKAQILSDIGAGTLSSFVVSADTNTATTTITSSANTLTIKGGTGVSTVSNPDGTITINASGSSYTKWELAGDSGTNQDINDGDTATFNGVNGIVTETKTGDILEIGFPIASLTAATVAGGDLVAIADINDSNNIRKVTAQSIADLAPQGDITAVQADSTNDNRLGIAVVDSTGPIPKVGLDIVGLTELTSGAAGDFLPIYDLDVTKNKKISLSSLASYIGAITSIASGAGIKVTTIGAASTVSVDYSSTGIIADGNSGAAITLADADTILLQDANAGSSGTAVVKVALSKLKTYIGAGTYTWSIKDGAGNTDAIVSGDEVLFSANAGLGAEVSNTPEVNFSLILNDVSTVTTINPATDFLVGNSATPVNQKILFENVHLNQWGDAEADVNFGTNKLLNVKNGTLSTDGVNLGQVEALVSGSSLFRGGYNANTGLTTDLSPNGSINGASNIATALGDFYAVTVAGTQLGVALEPGDLIFANTAIAANSNPANSLFTIVQSGQSIAGSGATDGATTKGVAGFDNDNFTVSSNGWVQLITRSTSGSYGSASKTVSLTLDDDGITTSASEQDIDITASQVSDFCTAVSTCIASNEQYTDTVGGAVSITVNHNLGTRDVMVQLYDVSSYNTVFADVVRTDADNVTLNFTSSPTANDIRVLITKVS